MITNKDISIDGENGKITLNGNKYDLGTQGEIDTAVKDVYSVMGQMGAKNLLVPEWVETQTTENGVTYTFNADGTIIMNTDASGATANTNCNLRQNTITKNNVFPAGTYTLTACPAGGSSTTYRTWARAYRTGTTTALTSNLYDEGNGVSFTVSEPFSLGLNATVMSGYVCNNLTWKPMLRYASDTDNTYQPYAMTNKQLTAALGAKQDTLTFDNVPTASSNNPVKSDGIKTYVDNAVSPITTNLKDFKNLFVSNPESTSATYTFSIPTNAIAELTGVSGTNLAHYYIIAVGTTLRIIKHTDDVTGLDVTLDSITDGVYTYTVTVPAYALSVAYRIS